MSNHDEYLQDAISTIHAAIQEYVEWDARLRRAGGRQDEPVLGEEWVGDLAQEVAGALNKGSQLWYPKPRG